MDIPRKTNHPDWNNKYAVYPLISGWLVLVMGKQSRINIITKLRNILRDEVTLPRNGKKNRQLKLGAL